MYGIFDWSPPGTNPRRLYGGPGPLSWTPPLSSSNRIAATDVSALWDEAEELRGRANVKNKTTPATPVITPPSNQKKIETWAPDVVVSLVHSEVMSLLRFVQGSADTDLASLMAVDASGSAHLVCKLTPPASVDFIQKDLRGLPSVLGNKGLRKSSRNAILAHASDLDLLYMECLGLGVAQNRHVYLLMLATLSLLHSTGQLFKHRFSVPRPNLLSREVAPAIVVPGHASYPAGHAAQAHGAANLIGDLLGLPGNTPANLRGRLIKDVAMRVADMRIVAGLHYAFDNLAGQALGQSLASLLNALGDRKVTNWQPYAYVAGANDPSQEAVVTTTLPPTPVLTQLWTMAAAEIAKANID